MAKIIEVKCQVCKMTHYITEGIHSRAKKDGAAWHCPSGHINDYGERKRIFSEIKLLKDTVQIYKTNLEIEQDRIKKLNKKVAYYKALLMKNHIELKENDT